MTFYFYYYEQGGKQNNYKQETERGLQAPNKLSNKIELSQTGASSKKQQPKSRL